MHSWARLGCFGPKISVVASEHAETNGRGGEAANQVPRRIRTWPDRHPVAEHEDEATNEEAERSLAPPWWRVLDVLWSSGGDPARFFW